MTNEEINKYIHTEIMGECWHNWRSMGPDWGYRCGDCGITSSSSQHPDYTSDESPRSLLMTVCKKVEELIGRDALNLAVLMEIRDENGEVMPDATAILPCGGAGVQAKFIARACVASHKESKKARR